MPFQDQWVGASSSAPQESLFSGFSKTIGGWVNNLDTFATDARQRSPDARIRAIPRQLPAIRSPTQFQYAPPNASTTTVDIDGGSGLFASLRDAAQRTLLTGLDNLTSQAQNGFDMPQPQQMQATQASYDGRTIAGFPLAGVIGVAIVGGFLVWKYG
jgi:hypothetical protein